MGTAVEIPAPAVRAGIPVGAAVGADLSVGAGVRRDSLADVAVGAERVLSVGQEAGPFVSWSEPQAASRNRNVSAATPIRTEKKVRGKALVAGLLWGAWNLPALAAASPLAGVSPLP